MEYAFQLALCGPVFLFLGVGEGVAGQARQACDRFLSFALVLFS